MARGIRQQLSLEPFTATTLRTTTSPVAQAATFFPKCGHNFKTEIAQIFTTKTLPRLQPPTFLSMYLRPRSSLRTSLRLAAPLAAPVFVPAAAASLLSLPSTMWISDFRVFTLNSRFCVWSTSPCSLSLRPRWFETVENL